MAWFSPLPKRLAAQAHIHLTWPAQHFVRLKHKIHGARSISCSPLQGSDPLNANTVQGASMPAQIIPFVLPANTVQGASMPAQVIPFVLPANTVQGASMPAEIIPFVSCTGCRRCST